MTGYEQTVRPQLQPVARRFASRTALVLAAAVALLLLVFHAPAFAQAEAPGELSTADLVRAETGQTGLENWRLTGNEQSRQSIVFHYENDAKAEIVVRLEALNPERECFGKTRSFNVYFEFNGPPGTQPGTLAEPRHVYQLLLARITANDDGQFNLSTAQPLAGAGGAHSSSLHGGPSPGMIAFYAAAQDAERIAALLAFVAALFALVLLLIHEFPAFFAPRNRRTLWIGLALFAFALGLRLVLPTRLVMAYGGYRLINGALDLEFILRYGAGSSWLYQAAMLFSNDAGRAYLLANTLLGAATLPLAALWFGRYIKRPAAGLILLALLAIYPILLRDHNSESNFIPAVFFLFVGLLNWERFRALGKNLDLLAAVAALAFTFFCRPTFIIAAPVLLLLRELAAGWPGVLMIHWRKLVVTFVGLLPVAAIHAAFLYVHTALAFTDGTTAGIKGWIKAPLFLLAHHNLFLHPLYTPLAFPLLAAVALIVYKHQRRALFVALSMGAVLVGLTFADAPEISYQRLQSPGAYFFATLVAMGLLALFERPRPFWRHPAIWLVLVAVSLPWPYVTLWPKNNADSEHEMMLALPRHLPPEPVTLARLSYGDHPTTWGVYRDFADWLFLPPVRDDTLVTLDSLVRGAPTDRPLYLYIGMRCYAIHSQALAEQRGQNLPKPDDADYFNPACERALKRFDWEPVFVQKVENLGSPTGFLWYPPRRQLTIGLYRRPPNVPK